MRTQILSYGGGVQSTAIAALIVSGKLEKPDLACIIDTEREGSKTWEYMDLVTIPALRSVGVELHRVRKSEFTNVDLYGGEGNETLLIPAFTSQNGVGKLPTFCSDKWKVTTIKRWAVKKYGVKKATLWMGISVDEINRAKIPTGKWEKRYPLVELAMNRGDCQAIVRKMGWPDPPRSSCWMCPNHRQDEWRLLKQDSPDDFRKAVLFEKYIQKKDPYVWLTAECRPLDEIDFDERNEVLFGSCDSGMCFV